MYPRNRRENQLNRNPSTRKTALHGLRAVLVVLLSAPLVLPIDRLNTGLGTVAYAFASIGISVDPDTDGDGLSDSNDICPNDMGNDCYQCGMFSLKKIGNCFLNFWDFFAKGLLSYIFQSVLDAMTGQVPVPGNVSAPAVDYRSSLERWCKSNNSRKIGSTIQVRIWHDQSYGALKETGCQVGSNFWPE